MGKTADLTIAQKKIIDTLHKEGKPQKVIAKKAGCSQSSVSKHITGKLTGRENCGRKRCTSSKDDCSLEMIVKKCQFKNSKELYKEWTEAGVKASKATMHRRLQVRDHNGRIPNIKPLLNQRLRQHWFSGLRRKRTGMLLSGPNFSLQVKVLFFLFFFSSLFIWKSRSYSLEEEWRCTESKMFEVRFEVSVVLDDLGCLLLVLVHCVSSPKSKPPSTGRF